MAPSVPSGPARFWKAAQRLPGRMPLRVKLTSALLVLVAVALAVISITGISVLKSYLLGQTDAQLTSYGAQPLQRAIQDYLGGGQTTVLSGGLALAWVPAGGHVQMVIRPGVPFSPESSRGRILPGPAIPASASWLNSHDGKPTTVAAKSGDARWRVLAYPHQFIFPDGTTITGTVIVGLDVSNVYGTIGRLIGIDLIVSLIIILVLAVVGIALVRSSLRPLTEIERTAEGIAAGDLSRRVPDRDPRTEVGRLGRSLNAMLSQIEFAFRARADSETAARRSEERMRQFVADASHELRTPLTAIRGFAEYYRQRGGVEDGNAGSAVRPAGPPGPSTAGTAGPAETSGEIAGTSGTSGGTSGTAETSSGPAETSSGPAETSSGRAKTSAETSSGRAETSAETSSGTAETFGETPGMAETSSGTPGMAETSGGTSGTAGEILAGGTALPADPGAVASPGSGGSPLTQIDLDRIMRRVEQESTRMGVLVEDMLLLARLDQQRPLESRPVDLLTLAADAVHDARVMAPGRSIDLTVGAGAALIVLGDEVRLRQVIGNLMSNALIHTPDGTPVEVRIRSGTLDDAFAPGPPVSGPPAPGTPSAPGAWSGPRAPSAPGELSGPRATSATEEPSAPEAPSGSGTPSGSGPPPGHMPRPGSPGPPPAVILEVADRGPGLTPDQAERAFERFYRADQARARHAGGTGLGLAIVAALVTAHGGAVLVEPTPGGGATFRIALPLAPEALGLASDEEPGPRQDGQPVAGPGHEAA